MRRDKLEAEMIRRYVKMTFLGCLILFTTTSAYAGYQGGYYAVRYGHYGYGYYSYGGHRGRHYGGYVRPYYGHSYRYYGGHRGRYYRGYGSYPYSSGTEYGSAAANSDDSGYDATRPNLTSPRDAGIAAVDEPGTSAYDHAANAAGNEQAPENASAPATSGTGWTQLADGHYSPALSVFAAEAQSHPTKGIPKVGYALSAAAGGDLQRGAWAMRRAFSVDPDGLHYIELNDSLRLQIEQLLKPYQATLDSRPQDRGAAFMVGSLHYLLGNMDLAQAAIDTAIQQGDDTAGTGNLQKLIEGQRAD